MRNHSRHFLALVLVFGFGCGTTPSEGDGGPDASSLCESDSVCDDGVFCNGLERCRPDDAMADEIGCVPPDNGPCLASQTCDEAAAMCQSDCGAAPDADADGHDAVSCGGDDCDDADAARFPGNAEICDADSHDEDCDPSTFGELDVDGDGHSDAACCNLTAEGAARCGADCDDGEASVHPTAPELCDGAQRDDDCDGRADEGLPLQTRYTDLDGDGHSGSAVLRCEGDPGSVPVADDCFEGDASVYVGAPELCDRIDNDCSRLGASAGGEDPLEDADGDGFVATDATCSGGTLPATDCNDVPSNGGAEDYPGAPEACDGRDNDCDGDVDEGGGLCSAAHGDAFCIDGACVETTCEPGWGSCNDDDEDGCETDLTSDRFSCGACGASCPGSCVAGRCARVVELQGGSDNNCARFEDGSVACWGEGSSGELGNGESRTSLLPVAVVGLADAVALGGAGGSRFCAVRATGGVVCWGYGERGELGDGLSESSATPRTVSGLSDATDVVVADGFSCALRSTGGVRCWGANDRGQLGDGTTDNSATPVDVVGLSDAVALGAGSRHACAIRMGGTMRCWGDGDNGALGDGVDGEATPTPVDVVGVSDAVEMTGGSAFTCVRNDVGVVSCWGRCGEGQAGPGTPVSIDCEQLSPVVVTGLPGGETAEHIAADAQGTCVRMSGGSVWCWGVASRGAFGGGVGGIVGLPQPTPSMVMNINDARLFTFADRHGCALDGLDRMRCWGSNNSGGLGDGTFLQRPIPVLATRFGGIVEVQAGGNHSCARNMHGLVYCWGENSLGQLGRPLLVSGPPYSEATAEPVVGLTDAVQLAVGDTFGCARRSDGTVVCWGRDAAGQLGDGTLGPDRSTVAPVSGLSDAVALAAGGDNACAIRTDGTLTCWGSNNRWQLADGTRDDSPTPVAVSGLAGVRQVTLGDDNVMALLSNGELHAAGQNSDGALGDGSTRDSRAGGYVLGSVVPGPMRSVDQGFKHACGVLHDGTVRCWGSHGTGQLGDGGQSFASQTIPLTVLGLTDVQSLAVGRAHSCAIRRGGDLLCWGGNAQGQLGIGSFNRALLPTLVLGGVDVRALTASASSTCAIQDGALTYCWGENTFGQLGSGTVAMPAHATVPRQVSTLP